MTDLGTHTHIPANNAVLVPAVTQQMCTVLDSLVTSAVQLTLNFQFVNDNFSDPIIKWNKIGSKDEQRLV